MNGLSIEAKPVPSSADAARPGPQATRRPLVGGLYFTDLLVVIISLFANLMRTCSVAELLDMVWYGLVYIRTCAAHAVFRLGHQMRARWKLSKRQMLLTGHGAPCFFSVFVLCGARYILIRFPFLLPRVTLAQETTGPLVQWRTGGGISQLVTAYDACAVGVVPPGVRASPADPVSPGAARGFRAYWIRGERRGAARTYARRAVVLFVHGGGFALGSVALYAEPLLRVLGHVHKASQGRVHAECVAVEYDLAPAARFPAPLLQCLRCYAHLVEVEGVPPEQIVLCGDSAGGGLVLSMLLCLAGQARDALVAERDWSTLGLPARAVLISPVVDVRPRHALVFAGLRQRAAARDERTRRALARRMLAQGTPGALDFLAPEALLHYAQLYTGVLERPRRAQGPAETLRAYLAARAPRPAYTAPLETLAYYTLQLLTRPLVRSDAERPSREAVPSYTSTRAPAVALGETQSDAVLPPGALYRTSALLGVQGTAQALLATHPLVSPALGAWAAVRLARGMYVTWGANEVLGGDIDAWAARVRLAWGAAGRGADLEVHVEPGPSGVHVWPFVGMYLAARQTERERGLRTLAHAILGLYPEELMHDESESDGDEGAFGSPASMPSDLEEDHAEDRAAQLAWEQELLRMGLRA